VRPTRICVTPADCQATIVPLGSLRTEYSASRYLTGVSPQERRILGDTTNSDTGVRSTRYRVCSANSPSSGKSARATGTHCTPPGLGVTTSRTFGIGGVVARRLEKAEEWLRELGKMPRVHSVGFFEEAKPIWE